ncbi:pectin lyase fold/virulence factor [Panaeolus papilionaceus]|nr:pectin lyase fold/virulence factor [Panaeolus papilionaceus]
MDDPRYMIIRIPGGYKELISCADPHELNAPPSSESGIFNVVTGFGADPTGSSLSTTIFTQAIHAANANGGDIIYVPPGIYPVGNTFIAHAVVPMATTRFTYDGPLIRHFAARTLMVTRSNNVIVDHAKMLNALSMGENDAVDIVDSQQVVVRNSIGLAWDDSFSTKTQPQGVGITINYPGTNQLVSDGAYSAQRNIWFEDGVVYKAAVGLGVHRKQGTAVVSGIRFTRMDIEELTGNNDCHQSWLAVFSQNGGLGTGPITNVSPWRIAIRDIGSMNSIVNGMTGSLVSDVELRDIWLQSLNRYVVSLAEAKFVPNSMASGVVLLT